MTRPARIVLVALGLAAAGAAFGALAGAVGLALAVLVAEGPRGLGWLEPFAVAAAFGAVLGVGLGPAAGWLLLRRVPLGVAVLGTLAGAVAGGAGSWLLRGAWLVGGPVGGAAAGFLAAAVALRLRYAAPRRALAPPAARRPPPAARRLTWRCGRRGTPGWCSAPASCIVSPCPRAPTAARLNSGVSSQP